MINLAAGQFIPCRGRAQGHNPLSITGWGRVTAQWWTPKIEGLHRNDFIMAAKTEEKFSGL